MLCECHDSAHHMTISITVTILSIFITFFSLLPFFAFSDQTYSTFSEIQMPLDDTGPITIAFPDQSLISLLCFGIGPYIAVADGRILKWGGDTSGFVDFAYTSPQRTKGQCDGTTNLDFGPLCGRPMAISFNRGTLYIADAYFGLSQVGLWGGLATSIATSADGVPFKFLVGVDPDPWTGNLYFSDASDVYTIRDFLLGQVTQDDLTGKFMQYNPLTRKVTDLLRGLNGGGSPAVSMDCTYVLFPEFSAGNVHKYWIRGPKANTIEMKLLSVDGNVIEINKAERAGEYWLTVKLIQKTKTADGSTIVTTVPQGWRIDGEGNVLQKLSFEAHFYNETVDVIHKHNGALYVASRFTDFIAVYTN